MVHLQLLSCLTQITLGLAGVALLGWYLGHTKIWWRKYGREIFEVSIDMRH